MYVVHLFVCVCFGMWDVGRYKIKRHMRVVDERKTMRHACRATNDHALVHGGSVLHHHHLPSPLLILLLLLLQDDHVPNRRQRLLAPVVVVIVCVCVCLCASSEKEGNAPTPHSPLLLPPPPNPIQSTPATVTAPTPTTHIYGYLLLTSPAAPPPALPGPTRAPRWRAGSGPRGPGASAGA